MKYSPDAAARSRDAAFALLVGILTSPVWVTTAVAVRISLGKPVLFRQSRPGLNGVPFVMLKFRTMREPQPGSDKASDRDRLTRLGRFLRGTSIDELPTLLNVVRGQMSIVGPRPLLTEYLERYTPEQARRHNVRPGVTGWAQINGRNALTWEDKFALDVWYVDNRSWRLDALIVWRTAAKVLRREGVTAHGHATMPEFMGPGADPRVHPGGN